jgi:two-component system sensor histidine kinase YesM
MISRWLFRIPSWKNKLSTRLIVFYCMLTVIPISLLGAVSYMQYTRSIVEQIGEYMPRFLSLANDNIAFHMQEFSELPSLLFNSDRVLSILRHDAYQSRSTLNQEQFVVNSYLARTYLDSGSPDIIGVFLFSKNRLFYSSRLDFTGLDDSNALLPYGQDLELGGEAKILLPDEFPLAFVNSPPYLLIMKQIQDVDNRKSLGTMLIAVQLTFIDNILRHFDHNDQADLWLMDGAGKIIYHTDEQYIGTVDTELARYPLRNGSFRRGGGKDEWIISLSTSGVTDWILAHSIPLKILTEKTDRARNVIILLFFCIVLITSLLAVSYAIKFTRPITKLSRLMRQVEAGRFYVNLEIESRDEVGILARSFNSMMKTIRELIQKNFEIKLRQKEAELYALQSQINPHFMYNTLETINMAVEDGKSRTVVEMVTLLGRMLRFSLSNRSRCVRIRDEVQHMRDFLMIQKIRFSNRLMFDITLKGDIESCYTPKFILQPIVENAVKYGLNTRKILHIHVSIGKELGARSGKEDIVFRIRDDGPGIPEEKLEQLEQSLRSDVPVARDSEFGLSNVNARIMLMLGPEYGLELHSVYGQGTEVVIRIPMITELEMAELTEKLGGDAHGEIQGINRG